MSAWMVAGSLRTTDASAAQWLQLQVTLVGPPMCASQNPHKCGLEHGFLGWPSMLVSEYKSICCSGARRVRFADPAFIRLYLYLLVGWGQRMSGLLNDNLHVLADTRARHAKLADPKCIVICTYLREGGRQGVSSLPTQPV